MRSLVPTPTGQQRDPPWNPSEPDTDAPPGARGARGHADRKVSPMTEVQTTKVHRNIRYFTKMFCWNGFQG